jgi:hypothetical protein
LDGFSNNYETYYDEEGRAQLKIPSPECPITPQSPAFVKEVSFSANVDVNPRPKVNASTDQY